MKLARQLIRALEAESNELETADQLRRQSPQASHFSSENLSQRAASKDIGFRGGHMTEESDRMLTLLQEVAAVKEAENSHSEPDAAALRKRRKEIGDEIKQLARNKRKQK